MPMSSQDLEEISAGRLLSSPARAGFTVFGGVAAALRRAVPILAAAAQPSFAAIPMSHELNWTLGVTTQVNFTTTAADDAWALGNRVGAAIRSVVFVAGLDQLLIATTHHVLGWSMRTHTEGLVIGDGSSDASATEYCSPGLERNESRAAANSTSDPQSPWLFFNGTLSHVTDMVLDLSMQTLYVADGNPAARVISASMSTAFSALQRPAEDFSASAFLPMNNYISVPVGSYCNTTQGTTTPGQDRWAQIKMTESIAVNTELGVIYFAQPHFVAVARLWGAATAAPDASSSSQYNENTTDWSVQVFFGNSSQAGSPGAAAEFNLAPVDRLAATTDGLRKMVMNTNKTALFVVERIMKMVRRIDLRTGLATPVLRPADYTTFVFPPPTCDPSCTATEGAVTDPIAIAYYHRRALPREGQTEGEFLFVSDGLASALFRLDLETSTVVQLVYDPSVSRGPFVPFFPSTTSLRDMTTSDTHLFIASQDGLFAMTIGKQDITPTPPQAPVDTVPMSHELNWTLGATTQVNFTTTAADDAWALGNRVNATVRSVAYVAGLDQLLIATTHHVLGWSMRTHTEGLVIGDGSRDANSNTTDDLCSPGLERNESRAAANSTMDPQSPWLSFNGTLSHVSDIVLDLSMQTLYVADGMPAARVISASMSTAFMALQAPAEDFSASAFLPMNNYINVPLGSYCDYAHGNTTPGQSRWAQIGPPESIAVNTDLGVIYYGQSYFIAVARLWGAATAAPDASSSSQYNENTTDWTVQVFFGNSSQAGSPGAAAEFNLAPVDRLAATSRDIKKMVMDTNKTALFVAERGMKMVRRIDLKTGVATPVLRPNNYTAFVWPPPTCDPSCTATEGAVTAPVAIAYYHRRALPREGQTEGEFLFVSDGLAGALFRLDLTAGTLVQLHHRDFAPAVARGPLVPFLPEVATLHDLTTSDTHLFIASADGLFAMTIGMQDIMPVPVHVNPHIPFESQLNATVGALTQVNFTTAAADEYWGLGAEVNRSITAVAALEGSNQVVFSTLHHVIGWSHMGWTRGVGSEGVILGNTNSSEPQICSPSGERNQSTQSWVNISRTARLSNVRDIWMNELGNLYVADSMPAARILRTSVSWASQLLRSGETAPADFHPSFGWEGLINVAVGSFCDFTQANMTAGQSASDPIGPPNSVVGLGSTGGVFFSQHRFVGFVNWSSAEVYFGNISREGSMNDTFNLGPIDRQQATSSSVQKMVLDTNMTSLFVAERGMHMVRRIDIDTGIATPVMRPANSSSLPWPPPTCDPSCGAFDGAVMDPVALAYYHRAAIPAKSLPEVEFLYISDGLFGTLFRLDLLANIVVKLHRPDQDPKEGRNPFESYLGRAEPTVINGLDTTSTHLFIATAGGLFALTIGEIHYAPIPTPAPQPATIQTLTKLDDTVDAFFRLNTTIPGIGLDGGAMAQLMAVAYDLQKDTVYVADMARVAAWSVDTQQTTYVVGSDNPDAPLCFPHNDTVAYDHSMATVSGIAIGYAAIDETATPAPAPAVPGTASGATKHHKQLFVADVAPASRIVAADIDYVAAGLAVPFSSASSPAFPVSSATADTGFPAALRPRPTDLIQVAAGRACEYQQSRMHNGQNANQKIGPPESVVVHPVTGEIFFGQSWFVAAAPPTTDGAGWLPPPATPIPALGSGSSAAGWPTAGPVQSTEGSSFSDSNAGYDPHRRLSVFFGRISGPGSFTDDWNLYETPRLNATTNGVGQMAFDASGSRLFITERSFNMIRQVRMSTGAAHPVLRGPTLTAVWPPLNCTAGCSALDGPVTAPNTLAYHRNRKTGEESLFVSSGSFGSLFKLSLTTNAVTRVGPWWADKGPFAPVAPGVFAIMNLAASHTHLFLVTNDDLLVFTISTLPTVSVSETVSAATPSAVPTRTMSVVLTTSVTATPSGIATPSGTASKATASVSHGVTASASTQRTSTLSAAVSATPSLIVTASKSQSASTTRRSWTHSVSAVASATASRSASLTASLNPSVTVSQPNTATATAVASLSKSIAATPTVSLVLTATAATKSVSRSASIVGSTTKTVPSTPTVSIMASATSSHALTASVSGSTQRSASTSVIATRSVSSSPTLTSTATLMQSKTSTSSVSRAVSSTVTVQPTTSPTVSITLSHNHHMSLTGSRTVALSTSLTVTLTHEAPKTRSETPTGTTSPTPSVSESVKPPRTPTVPPTDSKAPTPTKTAVPTRTPRVSWTHYNFTFSHSHHAGHSKTLSRSLHTRSLSDTLVLTATATTSHSASNNATASVSQGGDSRSVSVTARSLTATVAMSSTASSTSTAAVTRSVSKSYVATASVSHNAGDSPTASQSKSPSMSVPPTPTPEPTPSHTGSPTPSMTVVPPPTPTADRSRTPSAAATRTTNVTATRGSSTKSVSALASTTASSTVSRRSATASTSRVLSLTVTASTSRLPSVTASGAVSRSVSQTATLVASSTVSPKLTTTPSLRPTPSRSATFIAPLTPTATPTLPPAKTPTVTTDRTKSATASSATSRSQTALPAMDSSSSSSSVGAGASSSSSSAAGGSSSTGKSSSSRSGAVTGASSASSSSSSAGVMSAASSSSRNHSSRHSSNHQGSTAAPTSSVSGSSSSKSAAASAASSLSSSGTGAANASSSAVSGGPTGNGSAVADESSSSASSSSSSASALGPRNATKTPTLPALPPLPPAATLPPPQVSRSLAAVFDAIFAPEDQCLFRTAALVLGQVAGALVLLIVVFLIAAIVRRRRFNEWIGRYTSQHDHREAEFRRSPYHNGHYNNSSVTPKMVGVGAHGGGGAAGNNSTAGAAGGPCPPDDDPLAPVDRVPVAARKMSSLLSCSPISLFCGADPSSSSRTAAAAAFWRTALARVELRGSLGLLWRRHAWYGVIRPCHRFCAMEHASVFVARIGVLIVVICLALDSSSTHWTNDSAAAAICFYIATGILAAGAATAVQPCLEALFWATGKKEMKLPFPIRSPISDTDQDLVQFGTEKKRFIGVTNDTLTRLDDIEFSSRDDDSSDFDQRHAEDVDGDSAPKDHTHTAAPLARGSSIIAPSGYGSTAALCGACKAYFLPNDKETTEGEGTVSFASGFGSMIPDDDVNSDDDGSTAAAKSNGRSSRSPSPAKGKSCPRCQERLAAMRSYRDAEPAGNRRQESEEAERKAREEIVFGLRTESDAEGQPSALTATDDKDRSADKSGGGKSTERSKGDVVRERKAKRLQGSKSPPVADDGTAGNPSSLLSPGSFSFSFASAVMVAHRDGRASNNVSFSAAAPPAANASFTNASFGGAAREKEAGKKPALSPRAPSAKGSGEKEKDLPLGTCSRQATMDAVDAAGTATLPGRGNTSFVVNGSLASGTVVDTAPGSPVFPRTDTNGSFGPNSSLRRSSTAKTIGDRESDFVEMSDMPSRQASSSRVDSMNNDSVLCSSGRAIVSPTSAMPHVIPPAALTPAVTPHSAAPSSAPASPFFGLAVRSKAVVGIRRTYACHRYKVGGFIVCAVVVVVTLLFAGYVSIPWCPISSMRLDRWSLFPAAFIAACIVDVVMMQPLFILLVWVRQWLAPNRELEELEEAEQREQRRSALHSSLPASPSGAPGIAGDSEEDPPSLPVSIATDADDADTAAAVGSINANVTRSAADTEGGDAASTITGSGGLALPAHAVTTTPTVTGTGTSLGTTTATGAGGHTTALSMDDDGVDAPLIVRWLCCLARRDPRTVRRPVVFIAHPVHGHVVGEDLPQPLDVDGPVL